MRSFSLEQVREVLSSPAASRFFETWGQVAEERARAEERSDDLRAQALLAEARVRLAEEAARIAAARADEERRRAVEPGLDAALRPYVRLEAEALARAHLNRAHAALSEAHERRRRAATLSDEAEHADEEVETARDRLRELRAQASTLGGYVGEACLFFPDAQEPGAVYVAPLVTLQGGDFELGAFVLHRLPPGGGLAHATALRDTPPEELVAGVEELVADPLEPLPERSGGDRKG